MIRWLPVQIINTECTSSNNIWALEQTVRQIAKSFNDTRDTVETYFKIMQSNVDLRINAMSKKQVEVEQVLNNINRMVVCLYEANQNKTQ